MSPRQLTGFAAAAIVLIGGAACGNTGTDAADEPTASSSPSASESPSAEPTPAACSEVWVKGQKLPAEYESCAGTDGVVVQDEVIECSSGQLIFVHENTHYAAQGGTIAQAADVNADRRFKKILRVCKG